MALGLLGLKLGMTQIYDDNGKAAPVTVLAVGPCPVLQIRDMTRDGYHAVQLGFLDKKRRKASRAERGHVAGDFSSKRRKARQAVGVAILPKANTEPQRYIREFRLESPAENIQFPPTKEGEEAKKLQVGTILTAAEVFKEIKHVDVIGTSKGRGTTGVMKRHNFAGLPAAHGAKKVHRQSGSTGSLASNRGSGRPKKGLRRPGRYGHSRVTIRNLDIVRIDPENHLVHVKGAVPGPNGGLVMIRPTNKKG
jgi:large subunit ribosomal protein L3